MADIISRLKLESGEFDSKIKRAGQELMAYSEHCRKTGLVMGYANRDAKDFAKSLGNMQTTSSTARGKINELSDAFVNLRVMYKNMTDEEKNNQFGKNLAESLDKLKTRINAAKADLADVTAELNGSGKASGGGFLSGIGSKMSGALAVFGGNMMTAAAGAVANLGSEIADMVKQGIEMAKAGDGIRIAFERLGRGDILDGLRQATHGTVTDLELMKAAVKFNDFKLPVDELGTMLAFAQQKAKDTGQSVDYMVDSIVTGLGRKSLMILDNLGLSATEIKERMKETGDMTKAVGAIIREQMAKAGDYVETAADRAAQANVSLQNKMEELGRKFAPVEEASNSLWTSMKIGILDIIGGPLATLLNQLTEAGRMKNALNDMGGNEQVNKQLGKLRVAKAAGSGYMTRSLYSGQVEQYSQQIDAVNAYLSQHDQNHSSINTVLLAASRQFGQKFDSISDLKAFRDAYVLMKNEYVKGAREIMNATSSTKGGTTTTGGKTTTTTGIKNESTEMEELVGLIPVAEQKVKDLQQQIRESWDEGEIEKLREDLKSAQAELDRLNGKAQKIDLNKMFPDRGVSDGASQSLGEQMAQSIRLGMAQSIQEADMQTLRTLMEAQIKNGIEGIEIPANSIIDQILGEGADIPDEYWQNLQNQINEKLEEMGIAPLNIDFSTGKDGKGSSDNGFKEFNAKAGQFISGLSSVSNGLKSLGLQLPEGVDKLLGTISSVMQVIQGINTVIGVFSTTTMAANTAAIIANTAALYANTFLPGFANGGIVPHAANGWSGIIPGTSYSGDNIPIMVNSGELILNRAQQGNIASQLEGGGLGNLQLEMRVDAEELIIMLNNNGMRRGLGKFING